MDLLRYVLGQAKDLVVMGKTKFNIWLFLVKHLTNLSLSTLYEVTIRYYRCILTDDTK